MLKVFVTSCLTAKLTTSFLSLRNEENKSGGVSVASIVFYAPDVQRLTVVIFSRESNLCEFAAACCVSSFRCHRDRFKYRSILSVVYYVFSIVFRRLLSITIRLSHFLH
ncbi:uncharacterized protein LOC112597249 [Melanaphis sacchari]|uniref:uncharacterized protein LOC112597249 n=1 Tax=Melanaphis sacchari TaxID=742174 RepID=UPI000DC13E16|nr:uncharacterized protein LOC112597249 [Melanaphis sacchari]